MKSETDTLTAVKIAESRERSHTIIRKELADEQSKAQAKVYKRWMNITLKPRGVEVDDIVKDVQEGYQMFHLLEVLTGKSIPLQKWKKAEKARNKALASKKQSKKREKNSSVLFNRSSEVDALLEFIKDQDINITLDANNVVEGNATLIYGLIWTIILKYQNIQRAALLKWVKETLSSFGCDIKNFSSSWTDGRAFACLVASLKPEDIDLEALEKEGDSIKTLKTAFDVAKEKLGIPVLLEPSDVFPDPPSENIIMVYVSFFKNHTTLKPKEKIDPKDKRIQELESKLSKCRKKLKKQGSMISEHTQEISKLKNEAKEKDKTIAELKEQLALKEEAIVSLTAEMQDVLKLLRDVKGKLVAMAKKNKEYSALFKKLEQEISEGSPNDMERLENELKDVNFKMEEQSNKVIELEKQLMEAEKKIRALQEEIASQKGNESQVNDQVIKDLIAENELLAEQIIAIKDDNTSLQELIEFLNKRFKDVEKQSKETKTNMERYKKMINSTSGALEMLLERNQSSIKDMLLELKIE